MYISYFLLDFLFLAVSIDTSGWCLHCIIKVALNPKWSNAAAASSGGGAITSLSTCIGKSLPGSPSSAYLCCTSSVSSCYRSCLLWLLDHWATRFNVSLDVGCRRVHSFHILFISPFTGVLFIGAFQQFPLPILRPLVPYLFSRRPLFVSMSSFLNTLLIWVTSKASVVYLSLIVWRRFRWHESAYPGGPVPSIDSMQSCESLRQVKIAAESG